MNSSIATPVQSTAPGRPRGGGVVSALAALATAPRLFPSVHSVCWLDPVAGTTDFPVMFVVPQAERRDVNALGVYVPGADPTWWVTQDDVTALAPEVLLDEVSVTRWGLACAYGFANVWAELEVAGEPIITIEAKGRVGWIEGVPIVFNPSPANLSPGAELRIVDSQ